MGYFDWLAMGVGFLGSWLLSSHNKMGWIINAASVILWMAYGVTVHSWAIIICDAYYLIIAYRGYRRWSALAKEKKS